MDYLHMKGYADIFQLYRLQESLADLSLKGLRWIVMHQVCFTSHELQKRKCQNFSLVKANSLIVLFRDASSDNVNYPCGKISLAPSAKGWYFLQGALRDGILPKAL